MGTQLSGTEIHTTAGDEAISTVAHRRQRVRTSDLRLQSSDFLLQTTTSDFGPWALRPFNFSLSIILFLYLRFFFVFLFYFQFSSFITFEKLRFTSVSYFYVCGESNIEMQTTKEILDFRRLVGNYHISNTHAP